MAGYTVLVYDYLLTFDLEVRALLPHEVDLSESLQDGLYLACSMVRSESLVSAQPLRNFVWANFPPARGVRNTESWVTKGTSIRPLC